MNNIKDLFINYYYICVQLRGEINNIYLKKCNIGKK